MIPLFQNESAQPSAPRTAPRSAAAPSLVVHAIGAAAWGEAPEPPFRDPARDFADLLDLPEREEPDLATGSGMAAMAAPQVNLLAFAAVPVPPPPTPPAPAGPGTTEASPDFAAPIPAAPISAAPVPPLPSAPAPATAPGQPAVTPAPLGPPLHPAAPSQTVPVSAPPRSPAPPLLPQVPAASEQSAPSRNSDAVPGVEHAVEGLPAAKAPPHRQNIPLPSATPPVTAFPEADLPLPTPAPAQVADVFAAETTSPLPPVPAMRETLPRAPAASDGGRFSGSLPAPAAMEAAAAPPPTARPTEARPVPQPVAVTPPVASAPEGSFTRFLAGPAPAARPETAHPQAIPPELPATPPSRTAAVHQATPTAQNVAAAIRYGGEPDPAGGLDLAATTPAPPTPFGSATAKSPPDLVAADLTAPVLPLRSAPATAPGQTAVAPASLPPLLPPTPAAPGQTEPESAPPRAPVPPPHRLAPTASEQSAPPRSSGARSGVAPGGDPVAEGVPAAKASPRQQYSPLPPATPPMTAPPLTAPAVPALPEAVLPLPAPSPAQDAGVFAAGSTPSLPPVPAMRETPPRAPAASLGGDSLPAPAKTDAAAAPQPTARPPETRPVPQPVAVASPMPSPPEALFALSVAGAAPATRPETAHPQAVPPDLPATPPSWIAAGAVQVAAGIRDGGEAAPAGRRDLAAATQAPPGKGPGPARNTSPASDNLRLPLVSAAVALPSAPAIQLAPSPASAPAPQGVTSGPGRVSPADAVALRQGSALPPPPAVPEPQGPVPPAALVAPSTAPVAERPIHAPTPVTPRKDANPAAAAPALPAATPVTSSRASTVASSAEAAFTTWVAAQRAQPPAVRAGSMTIRQDLSADASVPDPLRSSGRLAGPDAPATDPSAPVSLKRSPVQTVILGPQKVPMPALHDASATAEAERPDHVVDPAPPPLDAALRDRRQMLPAAARPDPGAGSSVPLAPKLISSPPAPLPGIGAAAPRAMPEPGQPPAPAEPRPAGPPRHGAGPGIRAVDVPMTPAEPGQRPAGPVADEKRPASGGGAAVISVEAGLWPGPGAVAAIPAARSPIPGRRLAEAPVGAAGGATQTGSRHAPAERDMLPAGRELHDPAADRASQADSVYQARDRFAVETAPPVAGASAEKRTPSDAAAAISSARRDREAGPLPADTPQPDTSHQAPDRFAPEPAARLVGASATPQISPDPAPPGVAFPSPPLAMPIETASAPIANGLTEAAREAEPLPQAPLPNAAAPNTSPPNAATPATSAPNLMDPAVSITVHQDSAGRLEVHLAPEELGRVRVEMVAAGDRMQIHLAVERPESLDLLRRHGDQLLQEFRQSGIAGGSLSFGTWGQDEQQRHSPATPTPQNTPLPPDPLPSLAQQLRAQPAGPGLNLRL